MASCRLNKRIFATLSMPLSLPLGLALALGACQKGLVKDQGGTTTGGDAPERKLSLAESLGDINTVTEVTASETVSVRGNDGQYHNMFLGARISGDGHMLVYVPPLSKTDGKYQVWARDLDNPTRDPMIVSSMDGTEATASDDHMGHPSVDFYGKKAFFAGYASNLGGSASKHALYMKDLTDLSKAPRVISKVGNNVADCQYIHIVPSGKRAFAWCRGEGFPGQITGNPIYGLYTFDLTATEIKPEQIPYPAYPESLWTLSPANASIDGQTLLIEAFKQVGLGSTFQGSTILVYDVSKKTSIEVSRYYPTGQICASSWLSPDAAYVLTACKASDGRYSIYKIDLATKTATQPFADLTTKFNITRVGNRFFTDPTKIWTAGSFRRDGLIDLLYLGYKVDSFDANGNRTQKNEYFYLNSVSGKDLGNVDERCDWMEPSSDLTRFVFSCFNVKDGKRQLYRRGHFGESL